MFVCITWSQTIDTIQVHIADEAEKTDQSANKEKALIKFIDQDGNGLDDRIEMHQDPQQNLQQNRNNMDRFIDRDGDGICDGMESVFGLKKTYRKRKSKGNR